MSHNKHSVTPSYPHSIILEKIRKGVVNINSDVLKDAFQDFGWAREDILRTIRKLKNCNCYKTVPFRWDPNIMVDYYREEIDNKPVYTHFYVDSNGMLVIDSFHTIQ
jgi:hypothetical protein